MSADAWSMTAWSNAFRRMRIRPAIFLVSIDCRESGIGNRESESAFDSDSRFRTSLLQDLGHNACAHRPTTLTDGEAQLLFHGDRRDQLDHHLDVVARHDHLRPLGKLDR